MKKSIRVLFLLLLAVCGTAIFSSCITFALIYAATQSGSKASATAATSAKSTASKTTAPATEYIPAVDTSYWREQAEPRFLPESQVKERLADGNAWTRFYGASYARSFYGKTLDGKPVILDIAPGTVIHNLRDVFCEYAVSFRAADMPEDVRQFLQEYKTADGITYYEYVVSHTDRIVVNPDISGGVWGAAGYSANTNYPGERVINMNNSRFEARRGEGLTMSADFVKFLGTLIHEAGHQHLGDLERTKTVPSPLKTKSGVSFRSGNAVDERFANLQEMAFAKILREHNQKQSIEVKNYRNNSDIKRALDSEIGGSAERIASANRALGLPQDNYELFPEKLYVARKLRAGASIAATFKTTGVAATFNAVHAYLQSKTASQVESEGLIQPGDYIDLPAITVAGKTVTDKPITFRNAPGYGGYDQAPFEGYEGRLLRLIVVGINSFNGKNGNGISAHLVFQFQNVAFVHNMNPETEKDMYDSLIVDGYRNSAMRAYITGDFLPALIAAGVPESVLWGPKRFVKNRYIGYIAEEIIDKLWLPTEWEIFGYKKFSSSIDEKEENQARFAYYDDDDVRLKYGSSNSSQPYWLASLFSSRDTFVCVNAGLGYFFDFQTAKVATGCVPAFCVR